MVKKKVLKTIYNLGGFKPFHSFNQQKELILTYHRFSKGANSFKVSAEEFEEHLVYLSKHTTVLSLDELVEAKLNGKETPPNAAVITIDDGYEDVYRIAFPLLKKYNLPATFYVITDFLDRKIWVWTDLMRYVFSKTKQDVAEIELLNGKKINVNLGNEIKRMEIATRFNSTLKKMSNQTKDLQIKMIADQMNVKIPQKPTKEFSALTWKQAFEMDKNCVGIESHTVTHPILPKIDKTQLKFELIQSKEKLERKLNRNVEHFCYPNGSFNQETQKTVAEAGYKSATTTKYGFNNSETNLLSLKRIDAPKSIENFAQSVSGAEEFKHKVKFV